MSRSAGGLRVVVISASVGAGHDGAADELSTRLVERGFAVDQHDFIELVPASVGLGGRRAYAAQMRAIPRTWSWLMDVAGRRRVRSAIASFGTAVAGESVRAAILGPDRTPPAVVVSTHHLASQVIGRLRLNGRLPAPVVTFLTDMSVHPMWVSPGADAHLAIGPFAAAQARELGARDVYASAPAVASRFRAARSSAERAWARRRLGLPSDGALALVVAGSWGVGQIERTAADIASSGLATPVVACGHNDALRRRIARVIERTGAGVALGWVEDMPELLRASDVVVQNAGGLTSLEALATTVPMLTYLPIPGHGLANAAALEQAGVAPWVRSRAELADALRAALIGTASGYLGLWSAPDPADLVASVAVGEPVDAVAEDAAAR